MIQYIPDDGFYYLTLARHFVESGMWTFDGTNVTNGFHLLWGYILAGLYLFKPTVETFPKAALVVSLAIILVTMVKVSLDNKKHIIWLIFLMTSYVFVMNAISLTEFCLVLTCAYCVITNKQPFLFSILGVMARTEFLIIPMLAFLVYKDNRFLGAFIGLAIVMVHSLIFTGELLQSSALVKSKWGQYYSKDLMINKSLSLSTDFFYVTSILGRQIVLGVLILASSLIYLKNRSKELLISILVVLIYTALYWNNAGVQSWYAGMFFIPIFIIGKHILTTIRLPQIVLAVGIALNIFIGYQPLYPHQEAMKTAGEFLAKYPTLKVGSWNAGIIGYYQGGKVVNLDGLVNNSIRPYIESNKVWEYLEEHNIQYTMDFLNMYSGDFPKLGGYTEFNIKRLLVFDKGEYWWRYMTLSKVNKLDS